MTTDLPILSSSQIRELKAQAHHLDPVVLIGAAGLTPAVLREIQTALHAHELIKIRLGGEDRAQRLAMIDAIARDTGAQTVQAIGKLVVMFRERPAEPARPQAHVPKQLAAARLDKAKTQAARATPRKPAARRPRAKSARQ